MYPKLVWILWLQGWSNAPYIVRRVHDSYLFHYPDWHVTVLDRTTISLYLDLPFQWNSSEITAPALSDIVRLGLLQRYGGVWADASLLCMAPLSQWIEEATANSGVFMYHDGLGGNVHSWFVAAVVGSYVLQRWHNASCNFWKGYLSGVCVSPCDYRHTADQPTQAVREYNYFWMNILFLDLVAHDSVFASLWAATPYRDAKQQNGESATLHGRHELTIDDALLLALQTEPGNVLKLNVHSSPRGELTEEEEEALPRWNSYEAIKFSRMHRNAALIPNHTLAEVQRDGSLILPSTDWGTWSSLETRYKAGGDPHLVARAQTSRMRFHLVLHHNAEDVVAVADMAREVLTQHDIVDMDKHVFVYCTGGLIVKQMHDALATLSVPIVADFIHGVSNATNATNATEAVETLKRRTINATVVVIARSHNSGHEGETFLHHIVMHYHNPPDFTLFTRPAPLLRQSFSNALSNFTLDTRLLALGTHVACECTGCRSNVSLLRLRDLYALAAHSLCHGRFPAFLGNAFIVSRAGLLHQPLFFYELVDHLVQAPTSHWIQKEVQATNLSSNVVGAGFRGDGDEQNGLMALVLERLWAVMFGCKHPLGGKCVQ